MSIISLLEYFSICVITYTGTKKFLNTKRPIRAKNIIICIILGIITAIGGGTIRDILMGAKIFWLEEPFHIIIISLVIIIALLEIIL